MAVLSQNAAQFLTQRDRHIATLLVVPPEELYVFLKDSHSTSVYLDESGCTIQGVNLYCDQPIAVPEHTASPSQNLVGSATELYMVFVRYPNTGFSGGTCGGSSPIKHFLW